MAQGEMEMNVTDAKHGPKEVDELNLSYRQAIRFITHELKNSVTAIGGFALRLIRTEEDPERRKQLEMIYEQTRFLETMSMRFLLASRLKQGKFPLYKERIDDLYKEVIESVMLIFVKESPNPFQESARKLSEKGPIRLTADKNLLRIVFQNLLGNAVKYRNRDGRISLTVQNREGWYQVDVWNEGPGVGLEETEKIFDQFYRARRGTARDKDGTGLGLYNTRNIIEAHGGHISCTTEPGSWINFSFTLPGT